MRQDDFEEAWTNYEGVTFKLPKFPRTLLEWVAVTRKIIDGVPYSFIPYQYWIPIYRLKSKRLLLLFARQLFKTTYFANREAHRCTAMRNQSVFYVAPTEDKLTKFADEKFRDQTLAQNPILRQMCRGPPFGLPGRRGKVDFKNNSYWYGVTDNNSYGKVEGGSADLVDCDECQLHDLLALPILKESMSKKLGDLALGGIGGEGGSPWEDEWLNTTQAEWHSTYDDSEYRGYDGQGWRKDLEFGIWEDEYGEKHDGLKYGNYMKKVCQGEWLDGVPDNYLYPGFHLSQIMACHVPLSIRDSIDLYKLPPETSIEWKRSNYPQLIYKAHVLADMYKAPRRPLTRRDILKCMEPYSYMSFWSPNDAIEFKRIFPERVQIFMGIDWGSGSAGAGETVISIVLKWRGITEGRYSADRDRYFLIYQERLPYEMSEDMSEAFYAMELFRKYYCDYGTADMGFGHKQVPAMINGGVDPRDRQWKTGLSLSKFMGVWTRGKPEEVEKEKPLKFDDEGSEQAAHILMDKTIIIQNFVDMIKWRVPHPAYLDADEEFQNKVARMKFGIPYADQWKVDPLIKDWTSITRKDIPEDIAANEPIGSQKFKKEFNHPPDTAVSVIHCFVADTHHNQTGGFEGSWSGLRKAPKPGGKGGMFGGTRKNRR